MRIRPKLVVILAIAIMAPFAVLAHKAVGKSPVRMIRSTSGGSVSVALDGYQDRKTVGISAAWEARHRRPSASGKPRHRWTAVRVVL